MSRLLITGGAGFVGSHFVEHYLKNTDKDIVVLDKLTYASTWDRLRSIGAWDNSRVTCLSCDLSKPIPLGLKYEIGEIESIVHLAAETHVDNSIKSPQCFVDANITGTLNMLELARELQPDMFYYFSTDEVFGTAPDGINYKEDDRHNPTNPYSATKSGGEMLCRAYQNSYGVPVIITRCMNLFGEFQHTEKFIPLVINAVLNNDVIRIHANKEKTQAGSRFYIHARNCADAYLFLDSHGHAGGCWHIVGEKEVNNLDLALLIAEIIGGKLRYKMVDFAESRPGHDLRYSLDGTRLAELGWIPPKTFEQSLEDTVKWYLDNPQWLKQRIAA